MKKQILLSSILFALLAGCGGGGGGASAPAPNSIVSTPIPITGNYGGGSVPIDNLTSGVDSGLSAVNSNGTIWQLAGFASDNFNWTELGLLPESAPAAATAINSSGVLFAASTTGNVYQYDGSTWGGALSYKAYSSSNFSLLSSTESSTPTSMLVATGNQIYLGNQAGNLWFYSGSAWSQLNSGPSNTFVAQQGGITQIALDAPTPAYLGVATGSAVWACKLSAGSCTSWRNLTQEAGSAYTDSGSQVNTIGFNALGGYNYGYIGNANGNVWRATYQPSTGALTDFIDMTSVYPGYTDGGQVTSLFVDSNNTVYAGTNSGKVFIWTVSTGAWSNITPSGSANSITALTKYDSHTIFVGNASGQMWAIAWQ